jgi:hypothetical protein
MRGRAFLEVAKRLAQGTSEADWRTAAGRAYYALLLEGRSSLQRWGFSPPGRDPMHAFVRLRLIYATDRDLKGIGHHLEQLARLRNHADYQTEAPGRWFGSGVEAVQAVQHAADAIALLDQVEADSTRRAAAIAAIRAGSP